MKSKSNFIIISAFACIIACTGEFVVMAIFGAYYPGYNHLKDTMSLLGASVSPVSGIVSMWWVIMGMLLIFFGIGLKKTFSEKGGYAEFASWLIILYGIGEGIGSGVFKADRIADELTTTAIIHDIFGGVGVTAILLLPVIMQKVITKNEKPGFYRISQIVFITGIMTILLFLFRYSSDKNNFFSIYKGVWQRLSVLISYIYLTVIAVLMIKKQTAFLSLQKRV